MSEGALHILLVEDNPSDADLLQETLAKVDVQLKLILVERLEQAAEYVKQGGQVDAILLDLGLPDSTGIATLERANREASHLPIIVMTGLEDEAVGIEAVRKGAQDYLVKGQIRPHMLLRSIHHAIERKRLEKALRQSEAKYRELVQSANSAIIRWKHDGTIAFFNEYAQSLFGYSAEEVIGKHVGFLLPERDSSGSDLTGLLQDIVAHPANYMNNVNENICRDGRRIWLAWTNKPMFDEQGQVAEILAVGVDITERKRIEDAQSFLLQCGYGDSGEDFFQSLARYLAQSLEMDYVCIDRLVGDGLTAQTVAIFNDGKFDANEAYTLKDTPCGDVVGKTICCFPKDVCILFPKDAALQNLKAESYIGTTLWSFDGKPIGLIAIIGRKPLTQSLLAESILKLVAIRAAGELERKQAEEALRQSEARFKAIASSTPNHLLVQDRDLRYTFVVNPQLGLKEQDMIGKTDYDFLTKDDAENLTRIKRQVLETGSTVHVELPLTSPEGESQCFSGSYVPKHDARGQIDGLIGYFSNITDRKRADEALRQSEKRYRTLFDTLIEGFCIIEVIFDSGGKPVDYRFLEINPAFEAQTGLQNVQGRLMRELAPDHEAHWFEFYGNVALTGEPARFINEAKALHRWYDVSAYRIGGSESRKVAILFNDITERKRAEEAMAAAKAAAEAANEAKSRFLANISHELRTPMNAILGMVDLALQQTTDPTSSDFLQTARQSADLLLALLNDLLDCAKIESGKLELESAPFSLHRILDQMTQVLTVRAGEKGLAFACRIPAETPDALVGDQTRLRQILFNLATNAIKFTERGEVEMGVRVQSRNAEEACLEFAVRDTGIGISSSVMEHIFQPFAQADASTTRQFGGTGLGLSICSSLVAMMGGRIWVESELGRGSTFHFTVKLPFAEELPAQPEAAPAFPAVKASTLRILLVEDNPANQKLAAYILRDRGHTVEIAADGRQALNMTQDNRYDVILMDVQMPGMDGLEATAAIRAREISKRRVPIIAMTAFAMKGDRERFLAAGMDAYLSKPMNARELIALVETLAVGPATEATAVVTPSPAHVKPASPQLACVFDPELALKQCFNNPSLLGEMIQFFFNEVDDLLPQMRSELRNGGLLELGRLGHRIKGTVGFLGAKPATEAARAVERFYKAGGEILEAEQAVKALECEIAVLVKALSAYRQTGGQAN